MAPHIDNPLEFDFIEDVHKKQYLKSLFTDSFYEPNCDGKSNVIIKPIYFWPGQRVDLRCVMCRRAFTYNGLMKHWWFMPAKDVEDALENMKDLKNSPKWNQHLFVLSADYSDNRWRVFGSMPSSFEAGTHPRAQTVIVQRRGMLILLQPTSENEGLYRCLDIASRNVLHFVYYLIAMQPLFIYLKCEYMGQFAQKVNVQRRAAFLIQTGNFGMFLPHIYEMHLGCAPGTGQGHCYLRKIDQNKDIGQLAEGIFGAFDLFNWVPKLKNHMSLIPEFSTIGIRLYSGLLSKLIHEGAYGSDKTYEDCYTMEDTFFKEPKATNRWIAAIFAAFGIESVESMLESSDRLCLYHYIKPAIRTDEKTPASVLIGTHLIDTQRCPTI